jgi:hypothetical protein
VDKHRHGADDERLVDDHVDVVEAVLEDGGAGGDRDAGTVLQLVAV